MAKPKYTPAEREMLVDLCVPPAEPDCSTRNLDPGVLESLRVRRRLEVSARNTEGNPETVRLTEEGYQEALRLGGIRHRWGMVQIVGGRYKGTFGYYDDDDVDDDGNEAAILLLPDAALTKTEDLKKLGWVADYFREGRTVIVPYKHLRPFDDRAENAAAHARFAPASIAFDLLEVVGVASVFADLLKEYDRGEDLEADAALLRGLLDKAKADGSLPQTAATQRTTA